MSNTETNIDLSGIGTIGSIAAMILSYVKWHSFGWMIVHGCLGWIYCIYFMCKGY